MIDTNHILPERSLHTQTAALCCSGYVPYHNKPWVFFLHFIHLNNLLCSGELSLTCFDPKLITSKLPANDAKSSGVKKQPCSVLNVLEEMCHHIRLSQLIFFILLLPLIIKMHTFPITIPAPSFTTYL